MSKLIVIPTPIGNLEDITLRALRLLREADLVLAEDTRTTGKLLKHFDIPAKLHSHHKFNEHQSLEQIVSRIRSGETVALVSDAGTPAISDPGFLIVRACVNAGIEVECLPGATAFVPALVVSGLPNDRFCFEGFLPQKKGRNTRLRELSEEKRSIVFYESPYRVVKTLEQLSEFMGSSRKVSVSREISKMYEQTVRGSLSEVILHFKEHEPKGEFVIVLSGNELDDGAENETKQINVSKNKYKNKSEHIF